jgi:hypothetical protein
VFFNITHAVKRGYPPGGTNFSSEKPYFLGYGKYKKPDDAPGYPGSAAVYKLQLANAVRMMALLHEEDIRAKGIVYGPGDKSAVAGRVTVLREALDWADLTNKAQNDAIIDSLLATINAYPGDRD